LEVSKKYNKTQGYFLGEKERGRMMEKDIHNQEKKIKGRFTHNFTHSSGAGFEMKHERGAVKYTIEVIKSMDLDMIVELGTYKGGFTKLLEDAMPHVEIHTFDIENLTASTRKYFGGNVRFYIEDILENKQTVINLLARSEKKLLYCDNGRKKEEIALYNGYLYLDDYIGIHDWGNEIWWKDVEKYLKTWSPYQWEKLEEVGVTSRFWVKTL
jgi:hypothetical protein